MKEVSFMTQALPMNTEKGNRMDIICFSFTKKGGELGDRLEKLAGNYRISHLRNKDIEGGVKSLVESSFEKYDGIIFISATGIAVRYIAAHVRDKRQDPAVIVMDDLGRFVISLLSGHLGGANELANFLAQGLGAIPVVTTATDGRKIEALDIYAKRRNYSMENMEDVKKITALMVNGDRLGIYSEGQEDINYGNLLKLESLDNIDPEVRGLIIVTSRSLDLDLDLPYAVLIPKNINIGIGCKRGMETGRILRAIEDTLRGQNIYMEALREMATVEVKKDEEGILEASRILNIPLRIFTVNQLRELEDKFEGSDFVKKTIGVSSVSEPAAYLLASEMLVLKSVHNGITISVSKGGNNE